MYIIIYNVILNKKGRILVERWKSKLDNRIQNEGGFSKLIICVSKSNEKENEKLASFLLLLPLLFFPIGWNAISRKIDARPKAMTRARVYLPCKCDSIVQPRFHPRLRAIYPA